MIYAKHLDYIILRIIPYPENVIYASIKRNIVSVFLKNIMQPAQLKRGNVQIIKNYHLNTLQIVSLKLQFFLHFINYNLGCYT